MGPTLEESAGGMNALLGGEPVFSLRSNNFHHFHVLADVVVPSLSGTVSEFLGDRLSFAGVVT